MTLLSLFVIGDSISCYYGKHLERMLTVFRTKRTSLAIKKTVNFDWFRSCLVENRIKLKTFVDSGIGAE